MAAFSTIVTVAAVVVSAASSAYSAYAAQDNARDAKKAADEFALKQDKINQDNAARARMSAAESAEQTKDDAERLRAAQAAALAGSGVSLSSPTAGTLLNETDRLAERDALTALRGGEYAAKDIMTSNSMMLEASKQRKQQIDSNAQAQVIGAGMNFLSSAAGSYASFKATGRNSETATSINSATADNYNGTFIKRTGTRYSLIGGDT